jgi:hypothetical protein
MGADGTNPLLWTALRGPYADACARPTDPPPGGILGGRCRTAFGMFTIAGSHANANGWDGGMITAILNTNGGIVPDNR